MGGEEVISNMNIVIVNEKDEVIGIKPRDEKMPTDISRVASLIAYNSQNEILFSKRVLTKKVHPGKWDIACAGTVEEGETYMTNIIKEAEEELGLKIVESDLQVVSHSYEEAGQKYFVTIFKAKIDKDISEFIIESKEVEEIKWISISELVSWFEKSPDDFVPPLKKRFEKLTSQNADLDIFFKIFRAFDLK